MTPRLLSSKSVTEENQRTFPLFCSTRSPPPPPAKWPKPQYNKVSMCDVDCVAAARRRSHQWCLTLTPNSTETIERMTCHCFLQPIRRDLTTQLLHNCLKVLPSRFYFNGDTKGFCPRFKSQNYKT